jgi:cell division protease FtsH
VGGDLHRATEIALHYVTHWGMGTTFFSAPATLAPQDVYTDPQLRVEVEALLRTAYTSVRALLEQHRAAVIAVAEALLVREELDSDEILALIAQAEAPQLRDIAETALAGVTALPDAQPAPPIAVVDASSNGHIDISDQPEHTRETPIRQPAEEPVTAPNTASYGEGV